MELKKAEDLTKAKLISTINFLNEISIQENRAGSVWEMRVDKAINKLYSWGEALDPKFQQEMLDILIGKENKKKEYSIEEELEEQMKISKNLQQRINKAIDLLDNYTHYSCPEPEQNAKNENLVMEAYSILKGEEEDSD